MAHSLNYIIDKLESAQNKLCYSENNRQYIKALQSCKFWALKIASDFPDSAEYLQLFYTGAGFSFFDRVNNSILEYQYGNRPF